jgi:hypothetical protein
MPFPPGVFTEFDKLLRKADAKRRDWKRKQGKPLVSAEKYQPSQGGSP